MTFGNRLKNLRENAGLSQKKLAEIMGKPSSSGNFTQYENDSVKPSIEFLAQICTIFKVDADWLLFGSDLKTKKAEILTDPDLANAIDLLVDLYQNHGPNIRGWAIVTFEDAFQKYLTEKNESYENKKAQ